MVAENLGVITPEVEAMRRRFGFPGMAILQFAFGNDPQGPSFRPHNYERDTGGLHWRARQRYDGGVVDQRRWRLDQQPGGFAAGTGARQRYLNVHGEAIQWAMIRALMASVADTVLFPMQDLLGLGSEARMNQPGRMEATGDGDIESEQVRPELAERLRGLVELYER